VRQCSGDVAALEACFQFDPAWQPDSDAVRLVRVNEMLGDLRQLLQDTTLVSEPSEQGRLRANTAAVIVALERERDSIQWRSVRPLA
jgi:hypothetical protein